MNLAEIRTAIAADPANRAFTGKGWKPVYTAHAAARILIVGQAPGRLAQDSGIPWNDPSGDNLRDWLGLTRDMFYDERKIALVPMDFYFPGSGERGDMPPRKEFAAKWHPVILENIPNIRLTLLVGIYAQERYLDRRRKPTLTETVKAYAEYLPEYLPLVHPSPRNNIWHSKNPWFKKHLVPKLRARVWRLMS
jgi:uracil-DNA glycosylase